MRANDHNHEIVTQLYTLNYYHHFFSHTSTIFMEYAKHLIIYKATDPDMRS